MVQNSLKKSKECLLDSLSSLGLLLVSIYFALAVSSLHNTFAQETVVAPLFDIKFFEGDDPNRFFHPSDVGYLAGDLNGDGILEYLQHSFSANTSTSEFGDKIEKTRVCNYDGNDTEVNCSIFEGGFLFPGGDLNSDGRDELVKFEEGRLEVYEFREGEINISELERSYFLEDISGKIDQGVSGFDINLDGTEDFIFYTVEGDGSSKICSVFGSSDPDNLELKCFDTASLGTSVKVRIGVGDVVDNSEIELVLMYSESGSFPFQYNASVCSYDEANELECEDPIPLGSHNYEADEMRFFVADIDGENKEDLVYGHERYTGFDRNSVFYEAPTTFVSQSISKEEKESFTGTRVLKSNSTIDKPTVTGGALVMLADLFFDVNLTAVCAPENVLPPETFTDEGYNGEEMCQSPTEIETPEGDTFIFHASPYSVNNLLEEKTQEDRIGYTSSEGNSGGTTDISDQEASVGASVSFTERVVEVAGTQPILDHEAYTMSIADVKSVGTFFGLLMSPQVNLNHIKNIEDLSGAFYLIVDTDGGADNFIEDNNWQTTEVVHTEEKAVVYNTSDRKNSNAPGNSSKVSILKKPANQKVRDLPYLQLESSITLTDFQDFDEGKIFIRVANIGDVNGDTIQDLMIGSTRSQVNSEYINKAWVFFGGETFATIPDITIDFPSILGLQSFDRVGVGDAMEGIGDINGDGINDFATGLSRYDQSGAVFVFLGQKISAEKKDFRLNDEPDFTLRPRKLANQSIFGFGTQVSGGDFNGDGYNDIAILADFSFNEPAAPAIQIFYGGSEMDTIPDHFLYMKESSLGGDSEDLVREHYYASIQFLPKENEEPHQDILYVPGPRSGFPDAVIFDGGPEADSSASTILTNPNRSGEFGFRSRNKALGADLNGDGFYEVMLTNQFENEDAFSSSRMFLFSPNSGITISNEENFADVFNYHLSQNYPNPFNPSTNIEFSLEKSSKVNVYVFDLLGRKVATIAENQNFKAGFHTLNFDASRLSSGVYLYRLETDVFTQTQKMTLIK